MGGCGGRHERPGVRDPLPHEQLRSWALTGRDRMEGAPGVIPAETPEEAVAAALAEL